jgi:hypothetical protein
MKRGKLIAAMLGAWFILVITAASALALPDSAVTLGGAYPVHSRGSLATSEVAIGAASGVTLFGTGVTLLLLATELSELGTFAADFTNVKSPIVEERHCRTEGAPEGVVLSRGNAALVFTNLSPLTLGLLALIEVMEVVCPSLIILLRGSIIGGFSSIGSEASELTSLGAVLLGATGKQEISEYYNSTGTKVKVRLEQEFGQGFVATDVDVAKELKLEVLGSQMVIVTGR